MRDGIASQPGECARLRADRSLARKAIGQSLRSGSVVQTFVRTTARDVAVTGATIPEGSKVLLFRAAANRDPRRWTNPDRSVADRNASGDVAFGFGIRQCPGQMVARLEMEAVLDASLTQAAEIRLAGAPTRPIDYTVFVLCGLPLELVPAERAA